MHIQRVIKAEGLASPEGYSFATIHNGVLYTAGQIGMDADGKLVEGGVTAQTRQAMVNLGKILAAEGVGFDSVIRSTIYAANPADRLAIGNVHSSFFPDREYPARTFVGVLLPPGILVQIEMMAGLPRQT